MLAGRSILLVIGGGIAAYKSLDLIRRLTEQGAEVVPVLTGAAEEFVTALSVSALAGHRVYRDLFDLTDESEMGHIRLTRSTDLAVVAPATANLMARMSAGMATDLASTLLLATNRPILVAPAMNVEMWRNAATQRNVETLRADGVVVVGPEEGDMACGEFGPGRMAEPESILAAITAVLRDGPLKGQRILVTSGPTQEPIDPVRYLANRSSGLQGTAIANALAGFGAEVEFVTGPASAPMPSGCRIVQVTTAEEMMAAVMAALPVDAAVMAAAVADWRPDRVSESKISKNPSVASDAGSSRGQGARDGLAFGCVENPDILATLSNRTRLRPRIIVGFAAETEDIVERAKAKRRRKGCDWIVANDVSPETGVMGGPDNQVHLVTESAVETWPRQSKTEVALALADRLAKALSAPG